MRGSAVPSLVRTAARAGGKRLGAVWFNLLQTSLAAGLSWYLAHDVLDHPQPFFAPIAAAVSLSTSNVLRAQRAVQMMIGVTLGIGLGTVVQGMLGPGALPIAVAALVALGAAVFIGGGFIGHGMMFANQTVVSALLVLALYRGGAGPERIFDALIGGAVAIVVAVLLFPATRAPCWAPPGPACWRCCTTCCPGPPTFPPAAGRPRPTGR